MALKNVAEEYFSNLNSIAARLCCDLEETKSSYEELWATLSEKEQETILTESIIKPEVSIKYKAKEEKPQTQYAVKLIFDDNCSYPDEHSGPFSFRTQSQRDLSIFQTEKPNVALENKIKVLKPKTKQVPILYPDPFPECKFMDSHSSNESTNTLPKTGLDFLDNW